MFSHANKANLDWIYNQIVVIYQLLPDTITGSNKHSNKCTLCALMWLINWSHPTLFWFLTDHIDERQVCNAVSPSKDVDGFHVVNVGRMCLDQSTMLPATPWGVWEIIKRTGICWWCIKLLYAMSMNWRLFCVILFDYYIMQSVSICYLKLYRNQQFFFTLFFKRYSYNWEECCGSRAL